MSPESILSAYLLQPKPNIWAFDHGKGNNQEQKPPFENTTRMEGFEISQSIFDRVSLFLKSVSQVNLVRLSPHNQVILFTSLLMIANLLSIGQRLLPHKQPCFDKSDAITAVLYADNVLREVGLWHDAYNVNIKLVTEPYSRYAAYVSPEIDPQTIHINDAICTTQLELQSIAAHELDHIETYSTNDMEISPEQSEFKITSARKILDQNVFIILVDGEKTIEVSHHVELSAVITELVFEIRRDYGQNSLSRNNVVYLIGLDPYLAGYSDPDSGYLHSSVDPKGFLPKLISYIARNGIDRENDPDIVPMLRSVNPADQIIALYKIWYLVMDVDITFSDFVKYMGGIYGLLGENVERVIKENGIEYRFERFLEDIF